MKRLIKYIKGQSSFISWIKKRIRNNLNFIALLTGETGVGKSWTAIEIARQIDPEFDSTKQIAFDFLGFMNILNKFNDPKDEDFNQKKYKVFVFDEAQITANKHQWQSLTNQCLNQVLSTFRHQNIIVLFTTPFEDYIDSAAMKLFHAKFECLGWSKKSKKSTVRPLILQYNAKRRKMYEHFLNVINGGQVVKLERWAVKCPPKELTDPYEDAKFKFTNGLNHAITAKLEAAQRAAELQPIDVKNELNPDSCQPRVWDIVTTKGYKDQPSLAAEIGMDVGQLNRNIMTMRKKGYDIRKYKQGAL